MIVLASFILSKKKRFVNLWKTEIRGLTTSDCLYWFIFIQALSLKEDIFAPMLVVPKYIWEKFWKRLRILCKDCNHFSGTYFDYQYISYEHVWDFSMFKKWCSSQFDEWFSKSSESPVRFDVRQNSGVRIRSSIDEHVGVCGMFEMMFKSVRWIIQ